MKNLLPENAVHDILMPFVQFLPRLIGALFIVIIGLLIIKLITNGIKKMLQKSGIDSLKEKLEEVDLIGKANLNIVPSTIISKMIYYTLMLFLALIAAGILDVEAITQLIGDAIAFVPKLFVALLIVVLGVLMAEALKNVVNTACKSLGIPAGNIIGSFVFFFVLINALMIALNTANIPVDFLTDNLTMIIGGIVVAFGVGYGLASKNIMANYLASFYSKERFKLGDLISFDNVSGEIIAIDNTSVTIAAEGKRTIVPLSKLSEESITIHDN